MTSLSLFLLYLMLTNGSDFPNNQPPVQNQTAQNNNQKIYSPCNDIEVEKSDAVPVLEIVEEQAMFPGGPSAMMKFINENLVYPDSALIKGIEGVVVIEFIVLENGKLCDLRILKDVGGGCGEETVRVIQMMPDWEPGKQRNIPVRVRMRAPIKFKLSKK